MYAYNLQFGAHERVLVYPRVGSLNEIKGNFKASHEIYGGHDHGCRMHFMELFVEGSDVLDRDAGKHVLDSLLSELPDITCLTTNTLSRY